MSFNFDNYNKIQEFIEKNQNFLSQTSIISVSKTISVNIIEEAINKGITIFGENKIQEAVTKYKDLKNKYKNIELHMLGPLQTNKVKKALQIFDYFHSLDRETLANEFCKDNNYLLTSKKKFLIQINTGMEDQKSGISVNEADDFISFCMNDLKINVIGLMCIPPINQNSIFHFRNLKKLAIKHKLSHLSMGMSNDYESAIKEGATFIRIGTLLFGSR